MSYVDAAAFNYLSVCSGIEAATVAWHPLGWTPFAFSEIEQFPSQVLAHHYPRVPNLGDMTKYTRWQDARISLLVGGTPCQSFSLAGLRKGLDDPRGNLMLTYLAIAARYRPEWVAWENVPGVLSSNGGLDFASFLRGLAELGYGFAFRVLDAQYFGVPQRRRRVFVVGRLGDWRRAAAVLFERESLQGNTAPRRKAREGIAVSPTLCAGGNRTGGDRPPGSTVDTAESLIVMAHGQGGAEIVTDGAPALTCNHEAPILSAKDFSIRRLTPRECERLQGFPDDYTLIAREGGKLAKDGPRYKALGNSMAVPVMRWIGERIQLVEAIT